MPPKFDPTEEKIIIMRAIGGEIWVDVVSDLNHTGRFVYPSSQWLDRFRTAPAQSSAGEL